MKLKVICLSVFGVIFMSLVALMSGVSEIVQQEVGDDIIHIDGIDPTDMSAYYSMAEYYPPDDIDTLNVNWVGGRVEIIGFNEDYYFVEESATKYLPEDKLLSYKCEGNVFNVFYVSSDDVVIDDAYKKLEIRIPKKMAEKLKAVNVNTNGEVVFKNFKADSIKVNNINSTVKFENTYSKDAQITTEAGTVYVNVENTVGYSVDYKSKSGYLNSYVGSGKNHYISGEGTYRYNVKTRSGNMIIALSEATN